MRTDQHGDVLFFELNTGIFHQRILFRPELSQSWNRRYPLVKEGVIMFYPHAAVDEQKGILYLACENARQSYCVRIDLQALFRPLPIPDIPGIP